MKKLIFFILLLPCILFSQGLDKTYNVKSLSDLLDGDPVYPIRLAQSDSSSLFVLTENQMQLFVDNSIQRHKLAVELNKVSLDLDRYKLIDIQHQKVRDLKFDVMDNISATNLVLTSDIPVSLSEIDFNIVKVNSTLSDLNNYVTKEKSKLKNQKWWMLPLAVGIGIGCAEANIGTECLIGSGFVLGGWSLNKLL